MKRIISIFLSAVLILTFAFSASAAGVRLGDVTGDNKINSSDALYVLMAKVGLKKLSTGQKSAADVDGNGQINSNDALIILSYSIGLIKKFPADASPEKPTEKTTEKPTQKPTEKPTEKTSEGTTSKTNGNMEQNIPQIGHETYEQ